MYFILTSQQIHTTNTLVWIGIHCDIKNGKTRFASWGKSNDRIQMLQLARFTNKRHESRYESRKMVLNQAQD